MNSLYLYHYNDVVTVNYFTLILLLKYNVGDPGRIAFKTGVWYAFIIVIDSRNGCIAYGSGRDVK